VTLCTLRIENDKKLKETIQLLESIDGFDSYLPLSIGFKEIGVFYDKVLYIEAECEIEKLNKLRHIILDSFGKNNIDLVGNYYDFIPHLTVGKITNKSKNGIKSIKALIDNNLFNEYEAFDFGRQPITELNLCKMVSISSCQTYPVDYTVKLGSL
jgi:2'-5' RNA ligase